MPELNSLQWLGIIFAGVSSIMLAIFVIEAAVYRVAGRLRDREGIVRDKPFTLCSAHVVRVLKEEEK